MRRYLSSLFIFGLLLGGSILALLAKSDGYTDAYYVRFTTPKQHSLILGTSKAAQGLQPAEFQKILGKRISNFAFTIHHSSYGAVYLESIKRKLAPGRNDGVFVVTVDPWSISSTAKNPNDSACFIENRLCLANTKVVDAKPNFVYLWKNLGGNFRKILSTDKRVFLHHDGWLEANIDMRPKTVEDRTNAKLAEYRRRHLQDYHFSDLRLHYLEKTIAYLSKKGRVYLVRLPVHPEMRRIEEEAMPNFDQNIAVAKSLSHGYFDMGLHNSLFVYTDGAHLSRDSGREASRILAQWILNSTDPQVGRARD